MTEPNFEFLHDAVTLANSIIARGGDQKLDCALALCTFAMVLTNDDVEARHQLGLQMLRCAHELLPNFSNEVGQA